MYDGAGSTVSKSTTTCDRSCNCCSSEGQPFERSHRVRLVAARGWSAFVAYCKQTNVAGDEPDARKAFGFCSAVCAVPCLIESCVAPIEYDVRVV